MAEFFWRRRFGTASAVLLIGTALLVLLDQVARAQAVPLLLVLMLGLVLSAFVCQRLPWLRLDVGWRLLPPGLVLGATAIGILWADVAATDHAAVGFSIVAVLVLVHVGFTTDPGFALAVSPLALLTLLIAAWREPDHVTLALPLVAVPVAALVGELVAVMTDRADRSDAHATARLAQLDRLRDVLAGFRRPGSIEQAALQVAIAARDVFDVERSTVVLRDSQGRLIPVTLGDTSSADPGIRAAALVDETIHGSEPRFVPTANGETILVLPLPSSEAPAGAVVMYPINADDPHFTLDLARLFADTVGLSIEHLYAIDELSRANSLDELTGIGNRRHADALMASLQPGDALVLLDLDGFKTVNDTRGHAAGDQVLQALSAHLQDCLRDSDMSARFGGDEFLIVARRAHADPLAVATRVLQGWGLDRRSEDGPTPTLSAGVALHESDMQPGETFERADQALYQAKRRGKNQAQLWSPMGQTELA